MNFILEFFINLIFFEYFSFIDSRSNLKAIFLNSI